MSKPFIQSNRLTWLSVACLISVSLSACGDPGSGGSGLPGSASTGSTNASTVSGAANAAPNVSGSLTSLATIEALEANTVTIAGIRYVLTLVDIFLSDGSSTTPASLSVGQKVTISVSQDTPTQRWRLQISSSP
jgi:hypothetical protein